VSIINIYLVFLFNAVLLLL